MTPRLPLAAALSIASLLTLDALAEDPLAPEPATPEQPGAPEPEPTASPAPPATPQPPADTAAADALFREGRTAAEAGDYATACAKFSESQRLDPAIGTLLNLADCNEKLGKLADAWEHLQRALDLLSDGDDRLAMARERVDALETRVPRLVLVSPKRLPRGAAIERDGVPVGTASFGSPIPVNPGKHRVVVRAPGRRPRTFVRTIEAGERITIELSAGSRVLPTGSAEPEGGLPLGWIGVGIGGVGVVGLVAGAVTGALALDRASVVKDPAHCDASLRCDPKGVEAADEGAAFATASTVSLVVGGAALAGGAALFLFDAFGGESAATAAFVPLPEGVLFTMRGKL